MGVQSLVSHLDHWLCLFNSCWIEVAGARLEMSSSRNDCFEKPFYFLFLKSGCLLILSAFLFGLIQTLTTLG